jgi:hypothetical protein
VIPIDCVCCDASEDSLTPHVCRRRFPLQGTINNVKVLDLRYSNVTNSQLFKFTSLPALEELNLDSCSVGDVAIAHLADKNVCPNLVSLDLADNNLTDVGMEKIAKLRKLIRLSLFYCNITNVGLRHLSQLQDLEVLNLDSREITDEGLLPLKNLKKLKSLDIFSGRITDAGCRHISGMELLGKCGDSFGFLREASASWAHAFDNHAHRISGALRRSSWRFRLHTASPTGEADVAGEQLP